MTTTKAKAHLAPCVEGSVCGELSNCPPASEEAIRRDERHRVAALFDEHAEVIADFAADKQRLVGLMALLLRLGEVTPNVLGETGRDSL
jgi:hypothetical protein